MGLNLKINRIIFSTTRKYKQKAKDFEKLTESEVKQIAGRAGRSESTGYVSAFNPEDLEYVKKIIEKSNSSRSNFRIIDEFQLRIFLFKDSTHN
jgi:ATP-dependent RNA helicase SUPV3L1/SUV3